MAKAFNIRRMQVCLGGTSSSSQDGAMNTLASVETLAPKASGGDDEKYLQALKLECPIMSYQIGVGCRVSGVGFRSHVGFRVYRTPSPWTTLWAVNHMPPPDPKIQHARVSQTIQIHDTALPWQRGHSNSTCSTMSSMLIYILSCLQNSTERHAGSLMSSTSQHVSSQPI
jgi:hypothetical protein